MKIKTHQLLLAFLSVAAALVVPDDLEDGTYIIDPEDPSALTRRDGVSEQERWANWQSNPLYVPNYHFPYLPGVVFPDDTEAVPKLPKTPEITEDNAPPRDNITYHDAEYIPMTRADCHNDLHWFRERDYLQARESILDYCDRFLVSKKTRLMAVSKHGNVVAYVCNFDRKAPVICSRREWEQAEDKWLTPKCGALGPGFVAMDGLKKIYGRTYVGEKVCPELYRVRDRTFKGFLGRQRNDNEWKRDGVC